MHLEKLDLGEIANRLDEPFSMVDVAFVGDLTMSLYLCEGTVGWHRHLDHDELFWVHRGSITLDSERGRVRLRTGEMAVVQKGISHRSGSDKAATVMLIRCTVLPHRKNGRMRLYGTWERGPKRVSLSSAMERLTTPFESHTVARVEDAVVQIVRGEGTWPTLEPAHSDIMFMVLGGKVTIHTDLSILTLKSDELTIVPKGAVYHIVSDGGAVLAMMSREE
jgi:mannose-6-phosphate isomerase-like protein (cupin superfamily)